MVEKIKTSVSLSREIHAWLHEASEQDHRPVSNFVENLLVREMRKQETRREVLGEIERNENAA